MENIHSERIQRIAAQAKAAGLDADSLHGSFHDSRMPDHVRVGKIEDDKIVFVGGDSLENPKNAFFH